MTECPTPIPNITWGDTPDPVVITQDISIHRVWDAGAYGIQINNATW